MSKVLVYARKPEEKRLVEKSVIERLARQGNKIHDGESLYCSDNASRVCHFLAETTPVLLVVERGMPDANFFLRYAEDNHILRVVIPRR